MKRLFATLALATVALVAAACSSTNADTGNPAPTGPADPNAPVVVARDLRFTTTEVAVPAGKAFQLTFDNRDGAPHNVAIYTDSSAGKPVFQGEIFGGSASRVYDIPALTAGTYLFRCDVHPDMKGSIVAE